MRTLCLGVAGGSGSGKSELVRTLSAELMDLGVTVLHQDAYYRDQTALTPEQRTLTNYDHPSAIEFSLLVRHVRALRGGQPVEAPVYDFAEHNRTGYQETLPARLLVVEGILVLAVPEIRDLLDVSVFVDQSEDIRLSRRIRRDIEQRGRTEESVIEQFQATTQPMHAEFVEPSRAFADHVIRGDASGSAEVMALARSLRVMLNSPGSGSQS